MVTSSRLLLARRLPCFGLKFSLPRSTSVPYTIPFAYPTFDHGISELFVSAGRLAFTQPPPSQDDIFAYSAASSAKLSAFYDVC